MTTPLESALEAMAAQQSDPLIAAKCAGLMHGYSARWSEVEWECLTSEEEYELPLVNPNTGRESRTFTQGGKFDGHILYLPSGKTYLRESKTASEEIADPNAVFWKRWKIASQASHYVLGKWQQGQKVDGIMVDVTRKPAIRPRKIEGTAWKEMVQRGTYCGFDVPKEFRLLKEENHQLYSLRLARECLNDPQKYFQRRTLPRLDQETARYASELWEIGQEIRTVRKTGHNFRNHAACMQYNSPCEYLSVCCGEDTFDSDRWERVANVHDELPGLNGDGRNMLTNSRIACWQLCRMKHHNRYELGIRRRDEEEREALAFGALWHIGLDAWWSCFKKGTDNVNDSNSANAVDRAVQRLEVCNHVERQEAPF